MLEDFYLDFQKFFALLVTFFSLLILRWRILTGRQSSVGLPPGPGNEVQIQTLSKLFENL